MLDVLCIGDCVIDIFLKIPTSDPRFKLNKEKNELLINYGDKISVEDYILEIGGNATNTAVGLSRLNVNTGLCAEIGSDEFSEKIISTLKLENIDSSLLTVNSNQKTSITVALSYDGDRTLFTEHVKRNHDFNFEKIQTKMIYLTSLGHVWEKAYEKVFEFAKNNNILLAFNPGALQIEKRDKFVMDIIGKTDFLFVNKEEAEEILYGKKLEIEIKNNDSNIKKLLFGLKSLGAKNVIITDSDNGSYCQDEEGNLFHLGIIKVDSIEKTGAGDSFNAGFVASVVNGGNVKQSMLWGTINASSVIQKIGAEDGLLTKKSLLENINVVKDIPWIDFT